MVGPSLRLIQDSSTTLHIPISFCPLAHNICSVCYPSVINKLTSNLSISPLFNHYRFQFFLYLVFENILLQFLKPALWFFLYASWNVSPGQLHMFFVVVVIMVTTVHSSYHNTESVCLTFLCDLEKHYDSCLHTALGAPSIHVNKPN